MADETSVEYLDEFDVPADPLEIAAYLSTADVQGFFPVPPQTEEERRQAWIALHMIADLEQ